MNTDRLKECEKLRQMALDYIIANPGCWGSEIAANFGWKQGSSTSRLSDMAKEGEVRRVRGFYTPMQMSYQYYALVEKTKSAEVKMSHIRDKRGDDKVERVVKARYKPPAWVYRHTDPDRPCIPNQGGQGRSSPRMMTALEAME